MIGGPPAPPLRSKVSPGKFSGTNGVDHHQLHAAERLGPLIFITTTITNALSLTSHSQKILWMHCGFNLLLLAGQTETGPTMAWSTASGSTWASGSGRTRTGRRTTLDNINIWTALARTSMWLPPREPQPQGRNLNSSRTATVSHATYINLQTLRDQWWYQYIWIFGKVPKGGGCHFQSKNEYCRFWEL